MKYSEAKKQIKALSSKYDIDMEDGDFNVAHNGNGYAIYVSGDIQYLLDAGNTRYFSELPFSNKLYMILAELASTPLDERVEGKKQYVHVLKGRNGYLNIDISTGKMSLDDVLETSIIKAKFTDKEIEQLKQRDDIPLDWNKVHFKDA